MNKIKILATAYDEQGKKVDSMEGFFWNQQLIMIGLRLGVVIPL